MESRRVGWVWVILSLFVVFHRIKAENRVDPTDNVNLAPFDGWRSAHWCLNKTTTCLAEYALTEEGVLKPDEIDAKVYCAKGGCAEQTREILLCIHRSKRNYWFASKATVKVINDTITKICTSPSG